MGSSLVFFLVGLAFFGIKHLVANQNDTIRLAAYLFTGIAAGIILNLLNISPWPPPIRMPWGLIPFITGMGGLCLFAAEKWSLITKPGLKYFSTIILGLFLTGGAYLFLVLYRILTGKAQLTPHGIQYILLSLILICFLIVFGYTFPQRWFKRENPPPREGS